jgi:hypothetical protein
VCAAADGLGAEGAGAAREGGGGLGIARRRREGDMRGCSRGRSTEQCGR